MSKQIIVALCVNDGNSGMPHGHVTGVHFDNDRHQLEIEGDCLDEKENPSFSLDQSRNVIKIDGDSYSYSGYRQHYGNWSWDAVGMTLDESKRLAKNLAKKGFTPQGATRGQPFLEIAEQGEEAKSAGA